MTINEVKMLPGKTPEDNASAKVREVVCGKNSNMLLFATKKLGLKPGALRLQTSFCSNLVQKNAFKQMIIL